MENKLDILFYFKENIPQKKGSNFIELEQDHLACLVSAGHPFTAKESLSLPDLSNESIIACNPLNAPQSTAAFQQKLLEQRLTHNITMKVRDFHSMDGHAACQSGRLSMMGVYYESQRLSYHGWPCGLPERQVEHDGSLL